MGFAREINIGKVFFKSAMSRKKVKKLPIEAKVAAVEGKTAKSKPKSKGQPLLLKLWQILHIVYFILVITIIFGFGFPDFVQIFSESWALPTIIAWPAALLSLAFTAALIFAIQKRVPAGLYASIGHISLFFLLNLWLLIRRKIWASVGGLALSVIICWLLVSYLMRMRQSFRIKKPVKKAKTTKWIPIQKQ